MQNKQSIKFGIVATFLVAAVLIFSSEIAFAQVDVDGLCPLPKDYRVFVGGQGAKPNSVHFHIPLLKMSPGTTLSSKNVAELPPSVAKANFVVDEDVKYQFGFAAISSVGKQFSPGMIKKGLGDGTTAKNFVDWMPAINTYHRLEKDWNPSHTSKMVDHPACYTFTGFKDPDKFDKPGNLVPGGFSWTRSDGGGFKGWVVNTAHFAYHMDSPCIYGNYGNMGSNPDECDPVKCGPNPKMGTFEFTYFTPSVPLFYVASSALTITWDWPYKYSHKWHVHHVDGDGDGVCDNNCGADGEPTEIEFWTEPAYCCDDSNSTLNWSTDKFFNPKSCIQNPMAAENRQAPMNCFDRNGIPFLIYNNPPVFFSLPGKPAVVARSTIKVKDKSNVAHVQTGIENENTNVIRGECGKKLSEVNKNDRKIMTIRFVDNAVHANSVIVKTNELKCPEGEWDGNNFKVYFWFETPLYQYATYQTDIFRDLAKIDRPVIDMVYSPMFVWRKKAWNSLSEFLNTADGSISNTVYTYRADNSEDVLDGNTCPIDPAYIVYEKKIPLSKLFSVKNSDGQYVEDILPWHYAKTSLGDMLGNPPYEAGVENNLYGADLVDVDGQPVVNKFKYRPLNFVKGKGPLKYFVEIHDGSSHKENTGSGRNREEKKFDCADSYFKENSYTQGQLKINPESVKYVAYSEDLTELKPDAVIDPAREERPCLAAMYDDYTNIWTKNQKLLSNLNANIASGPEIIKYFQAWGKIDITDTIRPNVGLEITNTVTGTVRKIFKYNDFRTLKFYDRLISRKDSTWALIDQNNKFTYKLVETSLKPRPPFSLNAEADETWEFNDLNSMLTNPAGKGKINQGRDDVKNGDSVVDSFEAYGTAENIDLKTVHQDLRENPKKSFFVACYAYDNIDGQRVTRNGAQVASDFWYKGLASFGVDSNKVIIPTFPRDVITGGYTSLKIIDETYPDYKNNPVFKKVYMNDEYFKYPSLSFKKPNCKWDGSNFDAQTKEISLSYGVADRAGNVRKFKLNFFVAPADLDMMTIEKREKRNSQ